MSFISFRATGQGLEEVEYTCDWWKYTAILLGHMTGTIGSGNRRDDLTLICAISHAICNCILATASLSILIIRGVSDRPRLHLGRISTYVYAGPWNVMQARYAT